MKVGRSNVNEKTVFFTLEERNQSKLRFFLGAGSLLNILSFLFLPSNASLVCSTIGILLNILIIFFAFKIKLAPNFLFQLIPWEPVIFIIFGGREIFVTLDSGDFFTVYNLINVAIVLVTLIFIPDLFTYIKGIFKAKRTDSSDLNKTE